MTDHVAPPDPDRAARFARHAEAVRTQGSTSRRLLAAYDRGLAALDPAAVARLEEWVAGEGRAHAGDRYAKYFDLATNLKEKARWIVDLRLDASPPLRILDLGLGGGHFPHLARAFGHEVVGLDLDSPIFERVLEAYGLTRVVHRIEPGVPLPVAGPFDLVTGLQVTFNNAVEGVADPGSALWSLDDWSWFLDDLSTRLAVPGRIFLALNRQTDPATGRHHADDLMEWFEARGAQVDYWKHTVLIETSAPPRLARP